MAAIGRELVFRKQFPNAEENQPLFFQPNELHPAKADACVAAGVIGGNYLIGRERNSEAVREDHECARWAVSHDGKRRRPVVLPQEKRWGDEVDEERDVPHVTDATIPAE